jgi:hypothetical protein
LALKAVQEALSLVIDGVVRTRATNQLLVIRARGCPYNSPSK